MEQNVFLFGSSVFVTYKYLFDKKVPQSTVYNNTSFKSKKPWMVHRHPSNKKIKLISYDSIPLDIIEKYNLPSYAEIVEVAKILNQKIKNERKDQISQHLRIALELEYNSWEEIKSLYENEFLDSEKVEAFCKTHLLLQKAIELKQFAFKLKDIYSAFYQFEGLVFETDSYSSFCNKIRKIEKKGNIELELLHGLRKRISNNNKVTEDVIILIQDYFNGPKRLNARQICDLVNDYLIRKDRKTISLASVHKVIAQPYIQNQSMISRFGEKYTKNHYLSHMHFSPPHKEGLLWQMDGTRFQFAYKTNKKKLNFITYYVVLEAYNRKIIGFSYDESENSEMAIRALEMACRKTNYLPREVITDNSSAYRKDEYLNIISYAKQWKVNWRIITNSNSRENEYVESNFGVLQELFCRKYDGYIGEGVRSKNLNARPAPEEIKKNLSKKRLRDRTGLIELVQKIIQEYNESRTLRKAKNRPPTNKEVERDDKIGPVKLNLIKYCKLFWKVKILTVHDGMISFKNNGIEYFYNIYNEVFLNNYLGRKVKIRYNDKDYSRILVFDIDDDEYQITIKRMPVIPKASAERTDEENKRIYEHSRKNKELRIKLKQGIKDIKKEAEKIREEAPPELALFYPVSKEVQEDAEETQLNKELKKISKIEKLESFETKEELSFEEQFERLYKKKGNLKPFTYGNN